MPSAFPMFPLGTVLFPTMLLPLHVFEPRYREMTRVCLDGGREFGVVLIERGSEVGGGDVRFSWGTAARIVEAAELPDGRWVLGTVGVRRIRVTQWLPDDPYPLADVEDIDELPATPGAAERLVTAERLLRRALALKAELREPAPPLSVELDRDPVLASFQIAALAPIGPADAQHALEVSTAERRLELLAELLGDAAELLARRLS